MFIFAHVTSCVSKIDLKAKPSYTAKLSAGDPFAEDLAVEHSRAVFLDKDVLPMEAVLGDVRKTPVDILVLKFADKPVALFGKAEPLHAVVACIDDVVAFFSAVKHAE